MRIGQIYMYDSPAYFHDAKAHNLEFIEVCCNNGEDGEHFIASVDAMKQGIAETGVDVSCVGRWNHDMMKDGTIDKGIQARYKALLDAAMEVGAKTFVCGANYDESISLFRNYANAIEFFGDLIDQADGKIKIAVQNCTWNNYIVSPREWEVVLGELPELGLKYDASHAYNRGDNYLNEMSDWGERIAHVHIKGTTHAGKRWVDDPPAGMDDLHWSSIFSILYARGYDGDLSIEPHSATWSGELGDKGVEFTKKFIKQFVL
ncbi:MAG: sugar phosphate isomerase/epimerase [Ruminococcaceae bacterium]|nr:sugar phosphate isomerase/epimerase [Oscillospiraceae bacterium]